MSKLTDFLHPLWQKAYQNKNNANYEVNNAILEALDQEMTKTEQQTISAKSQLFLRSASDEWLDYWGSWFGLKRQTGQSDNDYRNALIKHVEHPRDTIPALRKAMALFMNEDVSAVHVYEPWTDIFILNDSKLNSKAHLMGDYYQYGVIDLQVNKPFDAGLIDVINWFRPGGVIWVLTYSPNDSSDAEVWPMSPCYAGLSAQLLYVEDLIGLDKHLDSNLTLDTPSEGYGLSPFILNNSKLNGTDVLKGSLEQSARYYNSLGYLTGLITPNIKDSLADFNKKIINVDQSNYADTSKLDNNSYSFTVNNGLNNYNYLDNTESLDKWSLASGNQLSEETYQGRSLMEFSVTGAQSFAPNKVHLVNGENYLFASDARYLGTDSEASLKLVVNTGDSLTNLDAEWLNPNLNSGFQRVSTGFQWSFPTGDYYVGVQADFEGDSTSLVEAGGIILKDANSASDGFTVSYDWCPSKEDYSADYTLGNYYIYGGFNLYKFYYEHVENQASVSNELAKLDNQISLKDYISDSLTTKDLIVSYLSEDVNTGSALTSILIYNFDLKIWERFSTKVLSSQKTVDKLTTQSLTPYINDNGLIFISLETTQTNQTYHFDLDAVMFYFDKSNYGDFAINLYSQDMTMTDGSDTSWVNEVGFNPDNDDLYAKKETGYPIQRIKLTYQKIADSPQAEINNKFTLNKSLLNGTDLIQDASAGNNASKEDPNFKNNYVNGNITNSTIAGLTTLATGFNDSVHNNLLGDLSSFDAKNRIFNPKWECLNGSATLDNTNNIAGFSATQVKIGYAGYIKATSNSLFQNKNYQLSYYLISDTSMDITTNVYINNNGNSYLVGSNTQSITANNNQTSNETDPFKQLNDLSTKVTTDFNTNYFINDSITILVEYSDKGNLSLTNPVIKLNQTDVLDGTSMDDLPDYQYNNQAFISNTLPIADNNQHTIEINLNDWFKANEVDVGFTKGNYQLKLEVATSGSSDFRLIKSNFIDNSVFTVTGEDQLIKLNLPSYNSLEDTIDTGVSVDNLVGAPDSHISNSNSQELVFPLTAYYFGTDQDVDISIHRDNLNYRVYSDITTNDQIVNPDSPDLVTSVTANNNLSLSDLETKAFRYQGVYGYLVNHDRLGSQLNDPVEFYKEMGITTTTTTTVAGGSTTTLDPNAKYMDFKVIKFNLIKNVKDIFPDFLNNTDKLSLSDQVNALINIIKVSPVSATVSLTITATNNLAQVSAYNYTNNAWDNFSTVDISKTVNLLLANLADYISPAGLINIGVYSHNTYSGSLTDIINLSDIELPLVIKQTDLDNSYLKFNSNTQLLLEYPQVKKLSIDQTDLSLTALEVPNSTNHQGVLIANVWSELASGTIKLNQVINNQSVNIASQVLDYGHQAIQFSIDFDSLKSSQLELSILGTNQVVYLTSVKILNCLAD